MQFSKSLKLILGQQLLNEFNKCDRIASVFGQNKYVKLANLELSTLPQRTDADCFHTLGELTEMTEKPIAGNITAEKFFDFTKQNAKCFASRKKFLTIKDEKKFVQNQTNLIGIVGRAGTGKTTLIKTLLAKALGKERLYNSKYIFYINMGIFASQNKINFFHFIGHRLSFSKKVQYKYWKFLFSNSILIFVDGFRNAVYEDDNENNLEEINLLSRATPQKFLINILKGNILPNAKKIIAFRPEILEKLPKECQPHSLINILGYNQDSKLNYIKDLYENYSVSYQFRQELNLILQRHCCSTIGFTLLFPYIDMIKHDESSPLLNLRSTTDLFTVIIKIAFNDNDYEKKPKLKKIAELAWNTFRRNNIKIGFYEPRRHIDSLDILFEKKLVLTVAMNNVWHLIIQEYLAAFYLVYCITATEFQKLFFSESVEKNIKLTSDRFEMITKFMFGLCSKTTFLNLNKIDSSLVFPEKQKQLLHTLLDCDQLSDDCFLKYVNWAYEMGCDKFTQQLLSQLEDEIYMKNKIQRQDFPAIEYFLKVKFI